MTLDKETLKKFAEIKDLPVRQYENFIPPEDNATYVEKLNQVIESLARIGRLNNQTVAMWNKVMEWVTTDTLESIVADVTDNKLDISLNAGLKDLTVAVADGKINELLQSGQFESIVESAITTIHSEVTDKLAGFNVKLAETEKRTPWKNTDIFTGNAIQELITNAENGSTILLQPGRYLVNSPISWSDKELHIVALGEVVFVEEMPLKMPMIQATRAHKSTIRGISAEGAETLSGFAGTSNKHYAFLKLNNSNKVKIYEPTVTNKSYGIILENCNKCKIYNLDSTGFLVTGSLGENGANYSSAVYILGGKKNSVLNLSAKDMGSGVLIGMDGKNHTVQIADLENMRDNGIYVSSGSGCKIVDVDVETAVSSGVKVRGSKHLIKNCSVKDAFVGFTLTGNGGNVDSLGYNGSGSICESNNAENCSRMGLEIGIQDGYYPRDFKVLNNNFLNCGESGTGYAPIKVNQGLGHQIKGNTITGSPSDFGILLNGTNNNRCEKYDVSQNTIRGNGATPKNGIRALYVDGSSINKNIFQSLATNGIDTRYVTTSTFDGNSYPEGMVVFLTSSYQSSGNIISNNIGIDVVPDLTQNTANGNIPANRNYLNSVSATPYARGQRSIISGVLYEAAGNTSPTDWKQISN